MRSIALLLVAVTGLLAACAATPELAPAPIPSAEAAPAPVAGYDWFLSQDGDLAALAYGQADSDDLKLKFDCMAGSGRLTLLTQGAPGQTDIHLESGGDTERYPGSTEPSALHDGDLLTAEASADGPVFKRFRRLGWIAAWEGETREVYAAHPGSEKAVSDFFAVCG